MAIERKSGARGLRAIIENALLDTMFELPVREDVSKVIITTDVVRGKAKPTLVPGVPQKRLSAKTHHDEGGMTARRPSVS